jgi:SAM-dependent methyltransferase
MAKIAPNFDRLAKPYRWLEYLSFGPYLQRARTHLLPALASSRTALVRTALVLGDGDGRFTQALLRTNMEVRVHAVDLSLAMLHALQQNAYPHQGRLTTEVGDLRQWHPAPGASYDLIATHFFLDCLTTAEIAALAKRLTSAVTPDTVWVVSDFAVPTNAFGGLLARPLVGVLYRIFRMLTGLDRGQAWDRLPDHAAALGEAGWTLQRERGLLGGLLISQIWCQKAGD